MPRLNAVEVASKPARKIDFGIHPNGSPVPWVALNAERVGSLGRTPGTVYPGWLRVWFLALSRMEASGHASFRPGELTDLLRVDSEGVVSDATAESVAKGLDRSIKKAVDRGLLDALSGRRCLVLPGQL